MEEARRQTQRQLDLVDRQITRRMTALIPGLLSRQTTIVARQGARPGAFLERYRHQARGPDRGAAAGDRRPVAQAGAMQEQAIARLLDAARRSRQSERV
jgi:hypothetical protein